MKFKYKISHSDTNLLVCKLCDIPWDVKNRPFVPNKPICYYYDARESVYCADCIEKLEITDPDFAVGLESEQTH